MTIDEIMEMAHKLHVYEPCSLVADAERRLLELVASIEAKERAACAQLCDAASTVIVNNQHTATECWRAAARHIAANIRARGDK